MQTSDRRDSTESSERAFNCLAETTGFQRDILFVIDQFDGGRPTGVEVEEILAEWYCMDVGQSRLYRNLRKLLEMELVAKFPVDGRTNSYYLTDAGDRCVEAYRRLITGRPTGAEGDDEPDGPTEVEDR